uniref:Cytochrome b n=1 Tax=Heterorhabditis bacteriophora TaxID=37862 RepID=A0A1I7WDK5_HETBA
MISTTNLRTLTIKNSNILKIPLIKNSK